jgi:hypothetical protein
VALIRDSHAAALLAALEPHLDSLNWRVTAFTGEGCGWLPPNPAPNCPGLRVIDRVLVDDRYAIVIAAEIHGSANSTGVRAGAEFPVRWTHGTCGASVAKHVAGTRCHIVTT